MFSYDALALLYEGSHVNGAFLQIVNIESFTLQDTLFGGIGAAKYVIGYYMPESLTNFVANNRLDLYLYRDSLRLAYTAGAVQVAVNDGTRFVAGADTIAIYDGTNFDIIPITSVTGNILNSTVSGTHNYAIGATVLVLRHRGKLSAVDATDNLQGSQGIDTISYFTDLQDILITANVLSTSVTGYECGWVAYNVLKTAAASGGLPDLVINASNFLMTTDTASGSLDGGANGNSNVGYSGTNTATPAMSFLQDVINTANGGSLISPASQFTFFVDVNNILYFQKINVTIPTVNLYLNTYQFDTVGDGLIDCVTNHTIHDNDINNIHNVLEGVGGQDTLGNPITVTVVDQGSVNLYGQKETLLTNTNMNTSDALKNWLQGQLNLQAYPNQTFVTEIYPSKSWVTCRDYVKIGFDTTKPNI